MQEVRGQPQSQQGGQMGKERKDTQRVLDGEKAALPVTTRRSPRVLLPPPRLPHLLLLHKISSHEVFKHSAE